MEPFSPQALLVALLIATALALRAIRKRSLSRTGAIAGFCVGFLIVATGWRGMVLLYFYQIGSWATKYQHAYKQTLDDSASCSAVRGPFQVLCCSAMAVILSLYHAYACGAEQPISMDVNVAECQPLASRLTCAILAHHATCLADTLASELGILAPTTPILVTQPWRHVPAGTNGGITLIGTVWSIVGGALMGALTVAMDALSGMSPLSILRTTCFGALCGLTGSFIDSLLGATLQATYWDDDTKRVHQANQAPSSAKLLCGTNLLTNEQVNLLSVVITTVLGGWVLGPWMYS